MREFILLSFVFIAFSAKSQESPSRLLLMNGREMDVYNFNDTSYTDLRFSYDKNFFRRERMHINQRRKAGKYFDTSIRSSRADALPVVLKGGKLDRLEVLTIKDAQGNEKLLYFYDPDIGNDMTPDAARAFVLGERDARVAKKGMGWFYGGLGAGFVGGYAARGSIWAVAVPPILSLSAMIPTVSIPERAIHDISYQYNDDYAAGFESRARSRNIRQALKGSVIGTVLGLVVFAIVDNN
jgi:hypothetical protein